MDNVDYNAEGRSDLSRGAVMPIWTSVRIRRCKGGEREGDCPSIAGIHLRKDPLRRMSSRNRLYEALGKDRGNSAQGVVRQTIQSISSTRTVSEKRTLIPFCSHEQRSLPTGQSPLQLSNFVIAKHFSSHLNTTWIFQARLSTN